MTRAIITLTTDFGLADPWVGAMKGVILSINPDCAVVDITHGIGRGDAFGAALALNSCIRFFPRRTVHVAVVDPGVGGERGILAAESAGNFVLAPDTGIAPAALDPFGDIPAAARFRRVENRDLYLREVSNTFHGRDLFAPVAAALASGAAFESLGPECAKPVLLPIRKPKPDNRSVLGEVIHVDRFGNLMTNVRLVDLPSGRCIAELGDRRAAGPAESYDSVPVKNLLWIEASSGFVEIAARDASAADMTGARRGTEVRFTEGE